MKKFKQESESTNLGLEKESSNAIFDPILQQLIYNNKFESTEKTLDLEAIWKIIWKRKFIVILGSMSFAVLAVLIALSIPNIYRSEVLLMPAMDESSNLGGLASKFGGLASLAGIDLSSGGSDKTEIALEIMKSRYFVTKFIEESELLIPLMASDGWEYETGQLSYDPDIYDSENQVWVRKVKAPFKAKPSFQEAYKEFSNILTIKRNKDSALITVGIDHYSPTLAKQWIDSYIYQINAEMKERDLKEAKQNKHYLQTQLVETNVEELKQILYQLIQEQEQTIMFGNVREQYAFKIIDPALVPEERVKPNRILIVLGVSLLGVFLSILLVFFLHRREEKLHINQTN